MTTAGWFALGGVVIGGILKWLCVLVLGRGSCARMNFRDSPAVVRGSGQGFYRLDPTSVQQVAQAITEAQAELADVQRSIERAYADGVRQESVEGLRTHRDSLKQRLKRLEVDLEEVRFVFGEQPTEQHGETGVASGLRAA
jgi:hypothetical protein